MFLILIAVALFASLSYVVTKSSRSGTPDLREKDTLDVANLLGFTSQIRVAVQRLKILNGVPITDLKFDNDVYRWTNGTLAFSPLGNPSDPRLYIFHAGGGGVPPRTFEKLAAPCPICDPATATMPGHINMKWTNVQNVGTNTSDPTLFVVSLKESVCLALNKRLGISSIPTLSSTFADIYPGPASFPNLTPSSDPDAPKIRGKNEFCYHEAAGTSRYTFLSVIEQF